MRTILFIIEKEFKQIFRTRAMNLIMFAMPLLQLLIIGQAATYDIKQVNFYVLDYDNSATSAEIITKFVANTYFTLIGQSTDEHLATQSMERNKADLIIRINRDFEENLVNNFQPQILFTINAVDGYKAGIVNTYAQAILKDYNLKLMTENQSGISQNNIEIKYSNWFNPELKFSTFMVPGILVILVTMISLFLTSMNVAREKEIGTIEQLNVTPIKKYQFIAGKLIPMLLIGLFELAFGLFIARLVFAIPMLGSLWLIFVFAVVYLVVILSIGLFISVLAANQQQAMFISFLVAIIFIFLSGLFTSISSMPIWAQYCTKFVPLTYFIDVMRNVMLKGSGFIDMLPQFIALSLMAVFTLSLAISKYEKSN